MQVGRGNVVGVFRRTVSGAPEIADDVPGCDGAADFKVALVGIIFPEMGVIVIPLFVKAADTNAPAAVLVPAQGFDGSRLHGDDRRAHLPHHVMAQVLSGVAVGTRSAEIVVVAVREIPGNGRESFEAVFCDPGLFLGSLRAVITGCRRCLGRRILGRGINFLVEVSDHAA